MQAALGYPHPMQQGIQEYLAIHPLPATVIISAWYKWAQNYCLKTHGYRPTRPQIASILADLGYERFRQGHWPNWRPRQPAP